MHRFAGLVALPLEEAALLGAVAVTVPVAGASLAGGGSLGAAAPKALALWAAPKEVA